MDLTLEPSIADRICTEHRAAMASARDAIQHAIEAGRLLLEAKAGIKHGEWLPWLAEHCELSERQAQRYMRLAQNMPKLLEANPTLTTDLTIEGALELVAKPKETELEEKPWREKEPLPFELGDELGAIGHHKARGQDWTLWVFPSNDEHNPGSGYFYVNVVSQDAGRCDSNATLDGTKKPIRRDAVAHWLTSIYSQWREAEWLNQETAPWDYNLFLYSSRENYFESEVLGKGPNWLRRKDAV